MKKILIIALLIGILSGLTTYTVNLNEEVQLKKIEAKRQMEIQLKEQKIKEEQEKQRAQEEKETQLKIGLEKNRIASVDFDSENLLKPSNITSNEMYQILKGTGLEDVSKALVIAENKYGINAIIMAALAAEESGWGNSKRAKTQNNLTGYAVYSDTSRGTLFSSRGECILRTAKLLKDNYLTQGGLYYNDTSLQGVNINYCSNKKWTSNINLIASGLMRKYMKLFR